jgi:hypothetical protein
VDYVSVVREILTRVAGHLKRIPKPGVDTAVVADAESGVFALLRLGWHAGKRVNNVVILARVRDGKVWIEDDNTDLSFADELLRAGVPASDIVLGFQPPDRRHLTAFAVA